MESPGHNHPSDAELLKQFREDQCQDAFATIVQRHLPMVYSAALRQIRSMELAQEISQDVFVDLASKASALRQDTVLGAWLYQVTRRRAVDVIRRESRRQAREQRAAQEMASMIEDSSWEDIAPVLDDAMSSLSEEDRCVVLLRFLGSRSFREVGELLNIKEDTAQKRVTRALDRLRTQLAARGVKATSSGFAAVLTSNSVQPAPVGLAGHITSMGMASLAAQSAATAGLIKTLIAMTTLKKTILIVGSVCTLLLGTAAVIHRNDLHVLFGGKPPGTSDGRRQREIAESRRSMSEGSQLLAGILMHASSHQGKGPTNVLQIAELFGGVQSPIVERLKRFEILPSSSEVIGAQPTQGLALREIQPRQRGGGGASRVYGFWDDRTEDVTEPSEGYEAWEKAHGFPPSH